MFSTRAATRVLDYTNTFRVGDRTWYDENPNLRGFDAFMSVLEEDRNRLFYPSHLERVGIWEELYAFNERRKDGLIPREIHRQEPSGNTN